MLIVADDLTGAHDSAIPFALQGIPTLVLIRAGLPVEQSLPDSCQVVSVNTDSRGMAEEAAYDTVRTLVERMGDGSCFKKIDSLLRGNTAREIEAMMDALGMRRAIIAPSFPEQGRIVDQGILCSGTRRIDAVELLAKGTSRTVGHLPLSVVRSGSQAIATFMHDHGEGLYLADALTHEDLASLRAAARGSSEQALLCGSAGLARHIAHAMSRSSDSTQVLAETRTVVLVGTRTERSARQLLYAARNLPAPVIRFPVHAVASGHADEAIRAAVEEAVRSPHAVTLIAVSSIFEELGHPDDDFLPADKIAAAFGKIAERLVITMGPFNFVTTGGDISLQVCEALGAFGIEPLQEMLAGIPLGKLVGGVAAGRLIVTKSGGFGEDSAIVDIIRGLVAQASRPEGHRRKQS